MNPAHDMQADEMEPEYDFSAGTRGKYATQFAQRTNVVLLDPDVAEVFATGEDVNAALRALIGIMRRQAERAAL